MSEKANMFEVAVRTKMRFPYRGLIRTEDLWDLSVTELDSIFKTLNAQVKQAKEESLLDTKSSEDKVLDMQIEIVKYVVTTKQEEQKTRLEAKEKREQKQKIMALIAKKQDEEVEGKSVEELQAMLDEL